MVSLLRIFDTLNEQFWSHPLTQQVWSFYESRNAAQQWLMRVAMLLVVALLLWLLVLSPLAAYAAGKEQDYLDARADLEWMQTNRGLAQQATALEQQSIEEVVNTSPLASYVSDLQARDDSVTLVLSDVPFNMLAQTLRGMSQKNAIQASSATIQRVAGRSGYVNATLVLGR